MLEEIVLHALEPERTIVVAGTLRTLEGLPSEVARAEPDVLVLGENDVELAATLLEQRPRLTVFAVAEEGEVTWLYALKLQRVRLGAGEPPGQQRPQPAGQGQRAGGQREHLPSPHRHPVPDRFARPSIPVDGRPCNRKGCRRGPRSTH